MVLIPLSGPTCIKLIVILFAVSAYNAGMLRIHPNHDRRQILTSHDEGEGGEFDWKNFLHGTYIRLLHVAHA